MLRALWFLIKIGVLIAAALWVAERPGSVTIDWLDYTITIDFGFFLLLALVGLILAVGLFRLVNGIFHLPGLWREHQSRVHRAKRIARYWPQDNHLPLLRQAQAARLNGSDQEALEHFAALAEHKDTAFLGVRGLLQAALDSGRRDKALDLARYALKLHPRQKWILQLVYDLEIEQRLWRSAESTLIQAVKYGAMSEAQLHSDRVALLLAQSEAAETQKETKKALKAAQEAYELDPSFVPAIGRLADLYIKRGKRRAAVKLIEQAWPQDNHPDLAEIWDRLAPRAKTAKKISARRMAWAETLIDMKPDSAESYMAAARVAMEQGLWGEARSYLDKAAELTDTARLYNMRAELERRAGEDELVVLQWLEKAVKAPADKAWMCFDTHRIYDHWAPVAHPHGAFNTMRWQSPDDFREHSVLALELEKTGLPA